MQTTMELLATALKNDPNSAAWCRRLGVNRTALGVAKQRGHLPPTLAGGIADALGQPVEKWISIAALESEKDSATKRKLLRKVTSL